MRRIRHQLVVLDEINSRLGERPDHRRGLLGREANAGFDNCADQRTAIHSSEPARAGDAELRSAKMLREGRGQIEIQKLQAGELREFVEIALHRGDQRGEIELRPIEELLKELDAEHEAYWGKEPQQ